MKPSKLWSRVSAYRQRRASLRLFLSRHNVIMTGTSLLLYMRKANLSYSSLIKDVDEGTQALYHNIYDKTVEIASIYKHHHIPHNLAGRLRSLAYYLKDLCEFHEKGLSGANNIDLQRGFERVLEQLTEIYTKALGKEPDNGLV